MSNLLWRYCKTSKDHMIFAMELWIQMPSFTAVRPLVTQDSPIPTHPDSWELSQQFKAQWITYFRWLAWNQFLIPNVFFCTTIPSFCDLDLFYTSFSLPAFSTKSRRVAPQNLIFYKLKTGLQLTRNVFDTCSHSFYWRGEFANHFNIYNMYA